MALTSRNKSYLEQFPQGTQTTLLLQPLRAKIISTAISCKVCQVPWDC